MRTSVVHLSTVHFVTDVRITVKQASTLARAGFDVTVIAREGAALADLPEHLSIESLPTRRSRAQRLVDMRGALRRALAHRPALVHLHDPELLALAGPLHRAGVRVVFDMHEDLRRQVLSKAWIPNALRGAVSHSVKRVEPALVRRCDGLVVVDERWLPRYGDLPAVLCRNLPLEREAEYHVGSAADVPMERRAARLVYAGGVERMRGAELMTRAVNLIEPDVRLDLCGRLNPDVLGASLDALDVGGRTHRHGWLSRPGVLDLFDVARAGVLMLEPLENYRHAFATKLFEYLRAGLPVIASDIPSHREVIERYGCGLLVPWNDPAALARAFERVLFDDDLARDLAAGARRAWSETDTFETEFENVIGLYERLGVTAGRVSEGL